MIYNDLAPEDEPARTSTVVDTTHLVVCAILDLKADLHAIAISLESINDSIAKQTTLSEAAAEINQITLTNLRAQLQGGIIGATIVPHKKGH